MNKRIERKIQKIYEAVFKKIFTYKIKKEASNGERSGVLNRLYKLQNSTQYDRFCKKFAKELAKMGLSNEKGIWRKYYEAAKSKHIIGIPSTYKEYELNTFKKAIEENFKMIKSVPESIRKVYEQKDIQDLIDQIALGKSGRKSFENSLKSHGYKNAKLIARTEAAKLHTIIDKERCTQLGSVCYIWGASNDKRTRPSHREMNGVVVFFRESNEKPLRDKMRGDAGEFPNCRCDIEPILDENDLTKNSYEVYDYRNDTIIKMSKNELLEKIQKGQL